MRIAIDFDSTINNLVQACLDVYNSFHDDELSLKDITTYDIYDCCPEDAAKEIMKAMENPEIYELVEPQPRAIETINRLLDDGRFKVYIATAGPASIFEAKCRWIMEHISRLSPERVISIQDKGILNVDVMIDDNIDQILSGHCYHRVLMDKPWNRNVCDEAYFIHRVNDWRQIEELIMKERLS